MFQSIDFIEYVQDGEYNKYYLVDSCFTGNINSPYGSPSLKLVKNRMGSTLTLLSIIKHYEVRNRNVALNLAYYYSWLCHSCGFYIDKAFIKKQLATIDLVFKNTKHKYYNSTCYYLQQRKLLFL